MSEKSWGNIDRLSYYLFLVWLIFFLQFTCSSVSSVTWGHRLVSEASTLERDCIALLTGCIEFTASSTAVSLLSSLCLSLSFVYDWFFSLAIHLRSIWLTILLNDTESHCESNAFTRQSGHSTHQSANYCRISMASIFQWLTSETARYNHSGQWILFTRFAWWLNQACWES